MNHFLRISLVVVAATLFTTTWASPALAHCGKCGEGQAAPDDQKPKCPMMKKHCPKCKEMGEGKKCDKCKEKMKRMHAWMMIREAVAVLHPTQGSTAKGVIRFVRSEQAVKIVADIEGLTPNARHAIHIHEFGDCSATDGTSAGGHYNPEGHPHALPDQSARHAGDLGNLQADANGKAHFEATANNICIVGPQNPIIGRAVIVHASPDDGGQPTGNAGARIACGVIGIANSPANTPPPAPAAEPATPAESAPTQ